MRYTLGVDIGTTFSAAAICEEGRAEIVSLGQNGAVVPSLVFLRADGELLVGDAAERRGASEPSRLARQFKRSLGDPVPLMLGGTPYGAETLYGVLLRSLVTRVVAERGDPPAGVAITHPANYGPYKLDLLRQAARVAEINQPLFISEPQAAAVYYASRQRVLPGDVVAVYDLGGGTFDAAIVRMTEVGYDLVGEPEGMERLGGIDFDQALFTRAIGVAGDAYRALNPDDPTHLAAVAQLREQCRRAKESLSADVDVSIPVILPNFQGEVTITRDEFEALIRPRVRETIAALERAVHNAGLEFEQLDRVLLVGGSSRIPFIAREIEAMTTRPVAVDANPKVAVALGAALWAANSADTARETIVPAVAPPTILRTARTAADDQPSPLDAPARATELAGVVGFTTRDQTPDTAVSAQTSPQQPTGPRPPSDDPPPDAAIDTPKPSAASKPARSSAKLLVLVGGLLVVGLGAGLLVSRSRGGSTSIRTSTTLGGSSVSTSVGGAVAAPTRTPSGSGMVAIPADTYPIGADSPDLSESARKKVAVNAYSIDAHEVTNREYKAFVDQTNAARPLPGIWDRNGPPAELANHPVQGVNFDWASAYCASLSKRLPTEIEWEVAAAGKDARRYAWGNDLTGPTVPNLPVEGTYDVMSQPLNKSSMGVYDLTGNVWEWVSDTYDSNKVTASQHVLRGGQNGYLRTNWTRLPIEPNSAGSVSVAGFRCAASVVATDAPALSFADYKHPPEPTTPTATVRPGYVSFDDFTDPASGWIERTTASWRFGYHPNKYFHVETKQPNTTVVALSPVGTPSSAKVTISTIANVEPPPLTEPGGQFEFGIVLRAQRAADTQQTQPLSYFALVVNPRAQSWEAYVHEADGTRTRIDGRNISVSERTENIAIKAEDFGDHIEFSINGLRVGQSTPGQVNLKGTGTGFVVNSLAASNKVHIHYGNFGIETGS